jgi:hypothetical protein
VDLVALQWIGVRDVRAAANKLRGTLMVVYTVHSTRGLSVEVCDNGDDMYDLHLALLPRLQTGWNVARK